jgi:hypothetical protein
MGSSNTSNQALDWYVVKGFGKPIGALGFIDDRVAVIASFYDDRDGNRDGKVSIPERVASFVSPLKINGIAVVEVAMAARFDMEVIQRDPDFCMDAVNLWLKFTKGLVIDGVYTAWMGVSINKAAGAVAKGLTGGLVKRFIVKKGMEAAVKMALKKAMGRD